MPSHAISTVTHSRFSKRECVSNGRQDRSMYLGLGQQRPWRRRRRSRCKTVPFAAQHRHSLKDSQAAQKEMSAAPGMIQSAAGVATASSGSPKTASLRAQAPAQRAQRHAQPSSRAPAMAAAGSGLVAVAFGCYWALAALPELPPLQVLASLC